MTNQQAPAPTQQALPTASDKTPRDESGIAACGDAHQQQATQAPSAPLSPSEISHKQTTDAVESPARMDEHKTPIIIKNTKQP